MIVASTRVQIYAASSADIASYQPTEAELEETEREEQQRDDRVDESPLTTAATRAHTLSWAWLDMNRDARALRSDPRFAEAIEGCELGHSLDRSETPPRATRSRRVHSWRSVRRGHRPERLERVRESGVDLHSPIDCRLEHYRGRNWRSGRCCDRRGVASTPGGRRTDLSGCGKIHPTGFRSVAVKMLLCAPNFKAPPCRCPKRPFISPRNPRVSVIDRRARSSWHWIESSGRWPRYVLTALLLIFSRRRSKKSTSCWRYACTPMAIAAIAW